MMKRPAAIWPDDKAVSSATWGFVGRFQGDAIPGGRVPTLHMIDWLGSAEHRSVGASLMRKAHEGLPPSLAWGEPKQGGQSAGVAAMP